MKAISRRKVLAGGAMGGSLGGSAVLGTILAACGGAEQRPTTLSAVKLDQPVSVAFWHTQTGSNAKALQDLVDKFISSKDKKIAVKAEFQGSYTQLHEKNMVAINAGTPTDVSVAYESQVAEYMRGSMVINLEDYVKDGTYGLSKESLEDIFPAYLAGLRFPQYDNKLLSFPFTKSLVVMYVNEEVLQRSNVGKLPQTWQEFQQAVQQTSRTDRSMLVDADVPVAQDLSRARTYGWGTFANNDASQINAWAYSRGGVLLTQDNKQVRYTEAPYLESFQLAEEMFKRQYAYRPPRDPGTEYEFFSNRMAFVQQSSTSRPFMRKVAKDNGRERVPWRIVNIPQKDPSKPATVLYGANVAIFKTTPVKQLAGWVFLKWLTDRDQDVQWSITSSYMPIRKSSAETPTLKGYWEKDDPQGKQAFDLSKYAKPEPNIRGVQEIRPLIQKALNDVMDGKIGSKAALEQATKDANQVMSQS